MTPMAMLENHDPRMQRGLRELAQSLSKFVARYDAFDRELVERVEGVVKDHAAKFKAMTGYEFPPLGLFVLPSARFIICARRDLEPQQINNQLLVWLRQFAERGIHPSAMEVAIAVQRCWPGYKPPIEHYRKDTRSKLILH